VSTQNTQLRSFLCTFSLYFICVCAYVQPHKVIYGGLLLDVSYSLIWSAQTDTVLGRPGFPCIGMSCASRFWFFSRVLRMSTKRKLSPNAKTRKNIKRIKAQKAVLDRSRSSNSINSAATKSSNTLVLGGANRFMPERYHNIMEVIDTTNTVLGTGGGTTAGVVYTANGIFDYTTTLGNNDVPGYSLLSPIYRNWRVKGIRIDYTASNTSSDPVIMQVAMFLWVQVLLPHGLL